MNSGSVNRVLNPRADETWDELETAALVKAFELRPTDQSVASFCREFAKAIDRSPFAVDAKLDQLRRKGKVQWPKKKTVSA